MKLKPLGKKLAVYQATAIASFIGLPIAFHFGWAAAFCICLVAFIFSGSQALSILIDANYSKYGLFGMRGPDTLIEYEPGDKDYETEKHWQKDDNEDDDNAEDDEEGKAKDKIEGKGKDMGADQDEGKD